MVESKQESNLDIPTSSEGWFTNLPEDISDFEYPIYYRYTDDEETVSSEEVGKNTLLPNIGPIVKESHSLNIFIREDLLDSEEKKKEVFLHELYEGYYRYQKLISNETAHQMAIRKTKEIFNNNT